MRIAAARNISVQIEPLDTMNDNAPSPKVLNTDLDNQIEDKDSYR